MKIRPALFSILVALLASAFSARSGVELLASFDNNGNGGAPSTAWRGESVISGFAGWMNLNTAAFSANTSLTSPPRAPFQLAPPVMSEFALTKRIDRTTPQILKSVAAGTVIPKIELIVAIVGNGPIQYRIRYVFGQATITLQQHDISARDHEALDRVAIHYETLQVTYFGINPLTGKADPSRDFTRFYDQTNP